MGLLKEEAFFFSNLLKGATKVRGSLAFRGECVVQWVGNVQCLGPPRQRSGGSGVSGLEPRRGTGLEAGCDNR